MRKYYRIKSVEHSGRQGERGVPRVDIVHPFRVNRIVELDDAVSHNKDIKMGHPLLLRYVLDENGHDYSTHYLCTSPVVDWDFTYDGFIRVETFNTIYKFERVDEG